MLIKNYINSIIYSINNDTSWNAILVYLVKINLRTWRYELNLEHLFHHQLILLELVIREKAARAA